MNLKQIFTFSLLLLVSYNGSLESFGFRIDKDGKVTWDQESSTTTMPLFSTKRESRSTEQPLPAADGVSAGNPQPSLPKSAQPELVKFPTILAQLMTPNKLLLTAGITAGLGIAYKTNSTVKNTVDGVGSRAADKAKTVKNRVTDWLRKPLTTFDVYATATVALSGYLTYKSNFAENLYNKSCDFTNSCLASGAQAYTATRSFVTGLPISPAVLGSGTVMAGTGLVWYLYNRYNQPSNYIQAYRKFEASLRPNLQTISEQYPKFIELYGLAEENPHCLLEKYVFDQAPLIKLLKPHQRRLLQEAIQLFDQIKK